MPAITDAAEDAHLGHRQLPAPSSASSAMNSDIVKPMPPSQPTP